jgi:protein subunit release factor B
MDWAAMIMNMYRSWAQRRGYTVTVIEEMPGELAGIKVDLFSNHFSSQSTHHFIRMCNQAMWIFFLLSVKFLFKDDS